MIVGDVDGTEPVLAFRALAALRLALIPVALVAQRLIPREGTDERVFAVVLAGGLGYALLAATLTWRTSGRARTLRGWAAGDLLLIAVLTLFSGGAPSPVRYAFFAVPFAAAFLARPRGTAGWCLAALSTYALVALVRPQDGAEPALSYALTHLGFLAWASAASVAFAAVLGTRTGQLAAQIDRSRRLAAQAVDAESHERRRLADALHDHAVQHLSVASRDIDAALEDGHQRLLDAKVAVDETLQQLRGEIFDLYPHVLDHAGLEGALTELATREARRGGFVPDVFVEPGAAGAADLIVLSVARELLTNAAKHAGARDVTVRVEREHELLVVRVIDDGCGFSAQRREEAVGELHYGLMATTERVEALGGTFRVTSAAGEGTAATARLPLTTGRRPTPTGA